MSQDIDSQNYTGELGLAAAVQEESNSYLRETQDVPYAAPAGWDNSAVDQPQEAAKVVEAVKQEPTAQELNFRALREEVDRMKAEREAERRDYQNQLDILKSNTAVRPQPQPQPERKFLDGMKDDDIPSVGELRRAWDEREGQYAARIEELQVAQAHPDYAEVIEKFALPLVQQKPHLAEGIHGARNKALFAYELGKMAQQMQHVQRPVEQPPARSPIAERIVENARKPGTLSQAGGSGALSQADYYASMSDAEFMRMANRNLESI